MRQPLSLCPTANPPRYLLPGVAKNTALESVHEQTMQALHEPMRVLYAHHEGQIEIGSRLCQQVNLELFEHFEDR